MNNPDHSCVLEQTHKPNGQRRHADDATPDPQMSALTYLHTDAGRGRIKEPIFGIEEQKEGGQKKRFTGDGMRARWVWSRFTTRIRGSREKYTVFASRSRLRLGGRSLG